MTSVFALATPALAQPSDNASRPAQSERNNNDDKSGLLGLLGLFGGLGLLGLRRRREEPQVRRTDVPLGAH